jgi:hypothetical protein
MAKKCISGGAFCIENMTLFLLIVAAICVVYAFYRIHKFAPHRGGGGNSAPIIINNVSAGGGGGTDFDNGVAPQNLLAGVSLPPMLGSADAVGLMPVPTQIVSSYPVAVAPINIQTRPNSGYSYTQMGILTPVGGASAGAVLPLMGRRLDRNKYQYYTVSNTHLNIKIPITVRGKNATGEYGCDEIISGDTVVVQGFNETYRVTVYESTRFQYLPVY